MDHKFFDFHSRKLSLFVLTKNGVKESKIFYFSFPRKLTFCTAKITQNYARPPTLSWTADFSIFIPDNWAFLFAQKMALKNRVPLHVCYCILPSFLEATIRHYNFLVKSLREVAEECNDLNINFHLLHGEPHNVVYDLSKKLQIGLLVVDFFPLRLPRSWLKKLQERLDESIPISQVTKKSVFFFLKKQKNYFVA